MKSCFALLCCVVLLGTGSLSSAHGAEATLNSSDAFAQQELKQQQIKTTTKRVGDQLESIIAEFDREGVGPEDR